MHEKLTDLLDITSASHAAEIRNLIVFLPSMYFADIFQDNAVMLDLYIQIFLKVDDLIVFVRVTGCNKILNNGWPMNNGNFFHYSKN